MLAWAAWQLQFSPTAYGTLRKYLCYKTFSLTCRPRLYQESELEAVAFAIELHMDFLFATNITYMIFEYKGLPSQELNIEITASSLIRALLMYKTY